MPVFNCSTAQDAHAAVANQPPLPQTQRQDFSQQQPQQPQQPQQQLGSQSSREEVKQSLIQAVRSSAGTARSSLHDGSAPFPCGMPDSFLVSPPPPQRASPMDCIAEHVRGGQQGFQGMACKSGDTDLGCVGRRAEDTAGLMGPGEARQERGQRDVGCRKAGGDGRRGMGAEDGSGTGSQDLLDEILAGIDAGPAAR